MGSVKYINVEAANQEWIIWPNLIWAVNGFTTNAILKHNNNYTYILCEIILK